MPAVFVTLSLDKDMVPECDLKAGYRLRALIAENHMFATGIVL